MLSIIIPSFFSYDLLEQRIKEINESFEVIIIENTRDFILKKKLESKYKNVKVVIPDKNLGFGAAYNLGIKLSINQYVFLSQPDVELIDNCLEKLIDLVSKFDDFTIISPYDVGNKDYSNYEIYNDYNELRDNDYLLKEVDFVDVTWLINKKNFEEADFWDENIFLYFEAMDFAKRLRKNNKKIFISKKINTFHLGSSSHDKNLEYFAKLTRCWHYNWSRFYYLKKHFGYYYALKKNLNIFYKILIKIFKNLFFYNKENLDYSVAEFKGLLNSILNKPSKYRPYEKIIK
jgi:N-acetylglucosaminyl-diphospho-decaprenol L-rhamnosyltransferase